MKQIKNIDKVEKILEENNAKIEDSWIFYKFWNRVDIRDNKEECWNWIGGTFQNGYGIFYLGHNKSNLAHRLSYILSNGIISNGLQVQHLCNNRLCCNPNHLELGDNYKNQQYRIKCGHNGYGEYNSQAILTTEQVRKIHNLYLEQRKLHPGFKKWQIINPIAQIFKVSTSTIKLIINGRTWIHIYDEFHKKE